MTVRELIVLLQDAADLDQPVYASLTDYGPHREIKHVREYNDPNPETLGKGILCAVMVTKKP